MSSNEYLTNEEKNLYRISYSNNKALLEIEKKILADERIIRDLEELIKMQVSDSKIKTEIIATLTSTFLGILVFKYALDLNKQDIKVLFSFVALLVTMYLGLTISEVKETEEMKKNLLVDYKDEDFNIYTRMKIKDLKRERKALLDIKAKIVNRETEINDILNNYQKIKEK